MDIRWIYSVEWQLKEDTAIWTTYHCWVYTHFTAIYVLPSAGSDYQPPTTPFICAGDRAQLSTDLNFVKSVQDELHDWDDRLVTVCVVSLLYCIPL